jgi:hypothetical protein
MYWRNAIKSMLFEDESSTQVGCFSEAQTQTLNDANSLTRFAIPTLSFVQQPSNYINYRKVNTQFLVGVY